MMASTSTGQSGQQSHEDPFFAGHKMRLPLKASLLDPEGDGSRQEWDHFKHRLLKRVCGARNTPDVFKSSSHVRQDWWRLEIVLEGMKDNFQYDHQLYDRIDDQLSQLLSPKSNFADVFLNRRHTSKIILDVASSNKDFATLDYKTGLTTNKGLVPASSIGMETICFHLYEKKPMDSTLPERCPQLKSPLDETKPLTLSEDARLQFKRLKTGDPANQKKKGKSGNDVDPFNPTDGKSYVEWIWNKNKRSLGEYVSGFSKVERGGAIYYGIAEKGLTGYVCEGLPLEKGWDKAIKEGICHKIRHEMLWIQRDPDREDGYTALKPEEIRYQGETASGQERCHFAVDFIEVKESRSSQPSSSQRTQQPRSSQRTQQPSSSQPAQQPRPPQAQYVLEVRVAPFNGVVFYDPQGPEAYRMEKEGEGFKPVRLTKEEWLEKMRDYGWCSKHKISKRTVCTQCESEQKLPK